MRTPEKNIVIRKAVVKDSKVISLILNAAFQEFKEIYTPNAFKATVISSEEVSLRMKNGIIWIAYMDNEPVGTVTGTIQKGIFHIQGMGVLPRARGNQVGYLLLRTIEEFAKNNSCNTMLLSTTPYLTKAIKLYKKFGFKIINEPPYDLYKTPLFNMKKFLEE